MSNIKLEIWGRRFNLKVDFDCLDDEKILDNQNAALDNFMYADINASLDKVKTYCLKHNANDIGTDTIENIFKYVMPRSIYVPRDSKKRVIAIMCEYRFDMEHGLAVVFENEKVKSICSQDFIL